MVRAMTIVVVLVLALLGASCGGGDDTASDTDTVLTETTEDITAEETTDETTTDETTTDDGSFATGDCAELVAAAASVSQAFSATSDSDDVDATSDQFDEFAENAPAEIRDDLVILAEAYREYADVLADVNIEPGEAPDAEAIAALQAAIAAIDQAELTRASANVSAWTTENC